MLDRVTANRALTGTLLVSSRYAEQHHPSHVAPEQWSEDASSSTWPCCGSYRAYWRPRPENLGLEDVDWFDDPVKQAYESALDRARVWAGDTNYFPAEWVDD